MFVDHRIARITRDELLKHRDGRAKAVMVDRIRRLFENAKHVHAVFRIWTRHIDAERPAPCAYIAQRLKLTPSLLVERLRLQLSQALRRSGDFPYLFLQL